MDIYAGYSWDICLKIVDALEKRVGRKVEARPVTMPANTRIMMVKVGIADIECGSSTNNVARQKLVAFSNTFYVADVRIMVRKDHGIRSLGDLNGKRVVTTLGTTADRLIKQQAFARNLSIDYLVGRSHAESMALMIEGKADAYIGDDAIVAAQRAGSPLGDKFAFLDETLATEPYGLMLPRDDPQFKKFVDEVLVGLMKSGELARLYDKWFMNPIPPDGINLQMPMSEKLKAAIANPNDKPVN
jgi:glutamate/aspartate transport system substrate-binding protein